MRRKVILINLLSNPLLVGALMAAHWRPRLNWLLKEDAHFI